MLVELVRTKTSDGVRLDGSLAQPSGPPATASGIQGVILLHGVGGSFYSGTLFDRLAECLLASGLAVLRVNTRGHGAFNMLATDGGAMRGGAAFETVDQCRHDIHAWTGLLRERGLQHIGLLGHSLGAIKALYAAAHDPPLAVDCLVAASPPRLSYTAFQHGPRSSDFTESLATAKQLVKQGRPEQLITVKFPFPLLISAASYVDKYGDERYNFVKFVDRVGPPTLFTYGAKELEEGGVAFAGLPEAIRQATSPAAAVDIITVPDADHFYNGQHDALATVVLQWLNDPSRFPATSPRE